jgi:hypothetical protein
MNAASLPDWAVPPIAASPRMTSTGFRTSPRALR